MKKKNKNKRKVERHAAQQQSTTRRATPWVVALVVVGAASFLYYMLNRPSGQEPAEPRVTTPSAAPQATEARNQELPPFHIDPENAKPFPATLDPSRFPISFVARAYAIAREIPDVLAQQPCYCNCQGFGHRSLLDCYASDHGAACTVCLKEAFLADQMTKSEKTPQEIRDAIVKGLWRIVDLDSP